MLLSAINLNQISTISTIYCHCMMEHNSSFLSCIKIRGVPILPPLIEPERRNELLEYKEKAILLERSLQNRRSIYNLPDLQYSKDIECAKLPGNVQLILPDEDVKEVDMKYVPFATPQLKGVSTDVCEKITDVTVDSLNNELMLNDNKQKPETCKVNEMQYRYNHQCEDSVRPRLIRSNSYTLDNPSSILLDHLKRHTSSSCEQNISAGINSEEFKSLKWKSIGTKEISSGIGNDLAPNETIAEINHKTEDINAYNHPSLEVITTDITIQQINFTASDVVQEGNTKSPCEETDLKSLGNETENTDPEIELNWILQQIPQNYANKISELIIAQKKEHQRRAQNYENIKSEMLQSGDSKANFLGETPTPKRIFVTSASNPQSNTVMTAAINHEKNRSGSIISNHSTMEKSLASSLNESQTLPFEISISSSESMDDFSLRTFRILDLEDKIGEDCVDPLKKKLFLPSEVSLGKEDVIENNDSKQRELQRIREEKAASIIGAHAKGYLVRRLMNTAKVKRIIQTIQDALVCALELQRSEIIEEADVELHRRLIKLVSSACYEFHDIFFALTIPEQMDIIAIDRQKIKKAVAVRTTHSSTELGQTGKISANYIRSSSSQTKI